MRVTLQKARRALRCALLTTWLAAGACGGSVEREAPVEREASPVPYAQFQAEFTSAICRTYAECCQQAGLPYNHANCVTGYTSNDSFTSSLVSEEYDPALGRRCIDTMARSASSCLLADLWSPEALAVCTPLFPKWRTSAEATGAIPAALGELCNATCDRASCLGVDAPKPWRACLLEQGLRCAADGTCQPTLNLGDTCDQLYDRCGEELACVAGHCIKQHATGPCTDNGFCISTSTCREGQCVPNTIVSAEFCAGE